MESRSELVVAFEPKDELLFNWFKAAAVIALPLAVPYAPGWKLAEAGFRPPRFRSCWKLALLLMIGVAKGRAEPAFKLL